MEKITRREFGRLMAVGFFALSKPCLAFGMRTKKRRPNVILILTDDQGWGDIRSHGNDKIDTPVMDALAAEGTRLNKFFVSPLCAPTRAGILTGRYHLRCGVHGVTRGYENMRSEEVTIAEALKDGDYVTGCFGKWHNGSNYPHNPNGQGFDEFFGFCAGHWNNYFDATLEQNGKAVKTKGYITDVITDAVLNFVGKNKDRPFFCYVPYNAPHGPFQVPDRYFDKYKSRGLNDKNACIYGMVENLDDNLGRILKKLAELRLEEDTIVIFATDNGPNGNRYNGNMRGIKSSVHQGGVRVPLFIRWPGHIEKGAIVTENTDHVDMFPTILELCGVSMPKTPPQDGISIVPLLKGKTANWPDRMIFTFSPMGSDPTEPAAVCTQRWRAVKEKNGIWHLYDMISDPGEKNDVAGYCPETVKKFKDAYEKAYKDVTEDGFEPLPIHLGYRQWPVVILASHAAHLEPPSRYQWPDGGYPIKKDANSPPEPISYYGDYGWTNDWIAGWTSTEAYAWWPIKVVEPGRFEVTLMYNCSKENLGARVRVEIGGKSVEAVVEKAFEGQTIYSPDRIVRGEIYEKAWAQLELGVVKLSKGSTKVIVRALEIPGSQMCEVKEIRLRRL